MSRRGAYDDDFQNALRLFWDTREEQAKMQRERGASDTGTRGAVTGGQHLLSMATVLEKVISDAGLRYQSGSHTMPGYYRSTKNWDGVVTYKRELVAILELKSQVGSFGKNQNNRIEEMIGQGRDIQMAARRDLLGRLPPWFGYVMIVEDHPKSRAPSRGLKPNDLFPVDPVFSEKPSYIERYRIAFHRLRLEGELSAACLVATDHETRNYWFPDETMSFDAFAVSLQNRIEEVMVAVG